MRRTSNARISMNKKSSNRTSRRRGVVAPSAKQEGSLEDKSKSFRQSFRRERSFEKSQTGKSDKAAKVSLHRSLSQVDVFKSTNNLASTIRISKCGDLHKNLELLSQKVLSQKCGRKEPKRKGRAGIKRPFQLNDHLKSDFTTDEGRDPRFQTKFAPPDGLEMFKDAELKSVLEHNRSASQGLREGLK